MGCNKGFKSQEVKQMVLFVFIFEERFWVVSQPTKPSTSASEKVDFFQDCLSDL